MHAVETLSNAPVSPTPAVPRSLRFVLGWAVVWAGFGATLALGIAFVRGELEDLGPLLKLSVLFAQVVGFTALASSRLVLPALRRLTLPSRIALQVVSVLAGTLFGSAAAIFSPPHHPYTWALLSAIPVPNYTARKRQRVDLPGTVTSRQPGQPGCVFEDRCPVKIGAVCEATSPPNVEVSPGHWIACHHPASFLQTLDPALSTAARP